VKPLSVIEQDAHAAWDAGNLRRARVLFARGASLGAEGCMLNLGYFYDEGLGVRESKQKAMHWYKRAYRKGSSAAASNIAVLYAERGRFGLAVAWYKRAAALGDGDAELSLAQHYAIGIGVRPSLAAASQHARRAVRAQHITPAGREEAVALLGGSNAG
jgi:TPR repeat protein